MVACIREDSLLFGWGGENFSTAREGGGQKIFNASGRGGEKFSIFDFSESLGKIRGHVKNLLRK